MAKLFYKIKETAHDLYDFASAGVRCIFYIPLYEIVKKEHRRETIRIPFKITHMALHGQRNARNDWNEMVRYYFS